MNTGHGDVHEIDIDDIPDFHGNIKDLSSSNTFWQSGKKVRNELVCLLVARSLTVMNVLQCTRKKENMLILLPN